MRFTRRIDLKGLREFSALDESHLPLVGMARDPAFPSALRKAAVALITDQTELVALVSHCEDPLIRFAALAAIDNVEMLAKISKDHEVSFDTRKAARQLTRERKLAAFLRSVKQIIGLDKTHIDVAPSDKAVLDVLRAEIEELNLPNRTLLERLKSSAHPEVARLARARFVELWGCPRCKSLNYGSSQFDSNCSDCGYGRHAVPLSR